MASLQNKIPSETYPGLLHIENDSSDAQALDGTLRTIEDGVGTHTLLQLSTTAADLVGVSFPGSGNIVINNGSTIGCDSDTNAITIANDLVTIGTDLTVVDDCTIGDNCVIGDDLTVDGDVLVVNSNIDKVGINREIPAHELHVTGDIGFSGDIIYASDTDTYISPSANQWITFTGGVKRLDLQSSSVPYHFKTHDVNFIVTSDSTQSPYPIYTLNTTGFVGIGNETSPDNLVHMKVQGANVGGDEKGDDGFTPEDANWMKNTFLVMENTYSSDGGTDNSDAHDQYMNDVSTGLKFRQKVYGGSGDPNGGSTYTMGLIEFAPRPAEQTDDYNNSLDVKNAKMDIYLAHSTNAQYKFKRAAGLKAYGYSFGEGETLVHNHETVFIVGPDSGKRHAGYISTLGAKESRYDGPNNDDANFAHPMHYTSIETDEWTGDDPPEYDAFLIGIQDDNFCESLNLIKEHVMRTEGSHTVTNGYAAGIVMQPGYETVHPSTGLTVSCHNYINFKEVDDNSSTITESVAFNFDYTYGGSGTRGTLPTSDATSLGSITGFIKIKVGGTVYKVPYYA